MKRAFSSLCCVKYSAQQIVELAKGSNLAVELRVDDAALDRFGEDPLIFQREGVKVTDIAASIFILHEQFPDVTYRYVDLAEKMGVGAVRIFAGESPKVFQKNLLSDVDGIIKGIGKLCAYAQEKGIEIWLETHSEISTGKLCRQILDAVAMPNLKIIWDVLHSIEYKETLDETLDYMAKDIVHIHYKDGVPNEDPEKIHYKLTDIAEGVMPFDQVFEKLKAIGFEGYVSLEWESPWRPEIRDLYPDPAVLLEKYNKFLDQYNI